jgi:hypothetical protein
VRTGENFRQFHGDVPIPKTILSDRLYLSDKVRDEGIKAVGAVNLKGGESAGIVAAPEAGVKVEAGGEATNIGRGLFEEEFGESFNSHGSGERCNYNRIALSPRLLYK